MEQKLCAGCEDPVIDKLPACPLQCRTIQCLSYKKKPIYDYRVMPIIWLMGGPGSGKATVCKMIMSKYGFVYVSVGQMMRDEMASASKRARCFKSVMGRGELAPNDLVIALLKEAIERNASMGARGFIVKGFPREKRQGLEFERDIGRCSLILYLEASEKTLFMRLRTRPRASERIDEANCTLRLRVETFMKHNPSIFTLYKYRLVKINAEESTEKVFKNITTAIDELLSRPEIEPSKLGKPIQALANKPIVWVLGGPGAGKGVQCNKIIAKYGFIHLSSEDLLRDEVKSGSRRAATLASIMDRGGLVPNDVVLELLREAIMCKAATAKGFLVDGYPREKSQGIAFEETIAPVTIILYLEASLETMTKRIKGRGETSGRADDNEDTIKLRLKTFLDNNQKVLDQYPNKIVRINAEESTEQVFKNITTAIDELLSRPEIKPSKLGKPIQALANKPIVWVLGGPGAGKGVQCNKIIATYGFIHLSSGDLLRDEVKSGSRRAATLASIMERGGLVPNDVVLELLREAILCKAATAKGFLVDGYPREKSQGIAFEETIAPVTIILYLEASLETMTKRIKGRGETSGRADDNEDTIKLRLKTFLDNNQKVLDQYPNKIVRINAEADKEAVFKQVQEALDPIIAARK